MDINIFLTTLIASLLGLGLGIAIGRARWQTRGERKGGSVKKLKWLVILMLALFTVALLGCTVTEPWTDDMYVNDIYSHGVLLGAGGGAEVDPVYSGDPAFGIAAGDIVNWNTAFSWGNPSLTYVPYTGATANVDLGVRTLKTTGTVSVGALTLDAGAGNIAFYRDANKVIFGDALDDAYVSSAISADLMSNAYVLGGAYYRYANAVGSRIQANGGKVTLYTIPAGVGAITWAGNEKLTLLNDGKLGIGITIPISKTHIYENTTATGTTAGLTVEQAGTGDAIINLLLTGVQRWTVGIDNSDSDKFKIGRGADWITGTDISITTAGVVSMTSPILTTPQINGAVTTTGLTLPAFTLGGAVTGGGQTWTNVGDMTFATGKIIASGSTNTNTLLLRANDTTFITFTTGVTDVCTITSPTMSGTWLASGTVTLPGFAMSNSLNMNGSDIYQAWFISGFNANTGFYLTSQRTDPGNSGIVFRTKNNVPSDTIRLTFGTGAATVLANWSAITQTGLVLSGFMDANSNYISFKEMAAPGAGAADTARIYAVVDGGALTDLAAVFQDGTVDIFAQETTALDAPILTYSSGTTLQLKLRKPHPGILQIVYVFPDGQEFVLKEYEYHDPIKIAANKGAEGVLPANWIVENKTQRDARLEAEGFAIEERARLANEEAKLDEEVNKGRK